MLSSRAVHVDQPHRHSSRGDRVEPKYAATYKFGKTTVHVVAPPPMTEEELARRKREFDRACLAAWNSLPVDTRLKLNLGVDLTKLLQRRLQTLLKAE